MSTLENGLCVFSLFAFVWCNVRIFGVMSSFCFGSRKTVMQWDFVIADGR